MILDTDSHLVRRAMKLVQSRGHPLYLFTLTAAEVLQVADVSRVSRDEAGALIGYQRPEVKSHVQDIVEYLDSDPVIFPNAIIMALSSAVKFKASRGQNVDDGLATGGTLSVPRPHSGQPKPAWIVDGQQRALALSRAVRSDLPVPITAFVADTVTLQRDQFLRVNNTKPLPRSLVTELLPEVDSPLPTHLSVRKAPSFLCERLNSDPDSPFHQMIRRASTSKTDATRAVIADNSVVRMLQESYTQSGGCLYPYRNLTTGDTDVDGIHRALCAYWSSVRDAFPDAWGRPPEESRLMHGAGIRAMGRLMDRVLGSLDVHQPDAAMVVRKHLDLVAPYCRWTSGTWQESGLRWDAVENTNSHIQKLSNYLIRIYVTARASIR